MFGRPSTIYTVLTIYILVLIFASIELLFGWIDYLFFGQGSGNMGPVSCWVKKTWSGLVLKLHGVTCNISGPAADRLKSFKGAVFVCNHQSMVDVYVMLHYLPENHCFLAKKELKYIPFFGWAAYLVGTIFINRSKGTDDRSLDGVTTRLQHGVSIFLYPEGTRSDDGRLLPFKRGAFVMAIAAKAPIIPITLLNSRDICPKDKFKMVPGTVEMVVDEPISTQNLSHEDRHVLSDQTRAIMLKRLGQ